MLDAMSTASLERPELYELRPLLYPALPADPDVNPTSPAALARSLRCAEPYGAHLYMGSSDGRIFTFIQTSLEQLPHASSSSLSDGQQDFRHTGTRIISNNKPIERIIVIPSLQVAAVLCESTLSFHELPTFLPIPLQVLPHIKGVATVALDDAELTRESSSGADAEGLVSLCIVRRKMIMLVKFSKDTWRVTKEIPLPGGATNARRFGEWLCISTTSEYKIVNLNEATISSVGLPISQTSDSPSASSRPSIISVASAEQKDRCEFIITSHSDDLTLGVFISQEGEPTAKLLEWPSHPRALSLEYPYLHALLRNDSIEVHNLATLEKQQTVHLPPLLEPRILSNATSLLQIVEAEESKGMSVVEVRFTEASAEGAWTLESTKTNRADSWRSRTLQERHTRSRVLMIGKNVVQGMCRTRVLDSAIKALGRDDIDRAQHLAEHIWEQRASFDLHSLETLELDYLNQMVAVYRLRSLRFEDAAKFLLRGRLDYRVVLSLFPSVSQGLVNDDAATVELFSNVVNLLRDLGSLDSFPTANLVLNYCPPLDVKSNVTLQKLHAVLTRRVDAMLDTLLHAYFEDELLASDPKAKRVLDTVLARLYIRRGQGERLSALLQQPSACDTGLIEPHLAKVGCFAALARIREQKKDWPSALDLYTKLLDGQLVDSTFTGTTSHVADMLNVCTDAELTHRYALWLVQHDADAGVKILTKGRGANSVRSEGEMLEELRTIDEKAATAFLEAIALTRKQHDVDSHQELMNTLMSKIEQTLRIDGERQAMQVITHNYVDGAFAESFVAHLALHAAGSELVLARLKLMALLQASTAIDRIDDDLLQRVMQEPLLTYEQAILSGKKRQDTEALTLLAVRLRDANSAETYCSQGRRPLSLLVMQSIEVPEVKVYASFMARTLKRAGGGPRATTKRSTGAEDTGSDQLSLLKTLLHVYMQNGDGNEFQVATTHLLNTQAMHLSTHDILATVPAHWTLHTLETFLSRSLRREMHRFNEGQIQRAMALAQNLEVAETLWGTRRGLGGVIDDGTEGGDEDAQVEKNSGQDELGRALVEKVQAQEKFDVDADADDGGVEVTDVQLPGQKDY